MGRFFGFGLLRLEFPLTTFRTSLQNRQANHRVKVYPVTYYLLFKFGITVINQILFCVFVINLVLLAR